MLALFSRGERMATYHLHVYFSPGQAEVAQRVRDDLLRNLPGLTYAGPLIDHPIGPHPLPMFELHLPGEDLPQAIPVIEQKRQGLSVLIHPLMRDHVAAHTTEARWLGTQLPLDLDVLRQAMR